MKKWSSLFLIIFFGYLLIAPESALSSARDGLLLWYHSILPALLPFMLLCTLVLRLGLLDECLPVLYRPIHLLTGCSPYGAFAILTGFLCGFPMGAKITHDLLAEKKISQSEADWLMGFVNNLSPGFLLSYTACEQMEFSSGRFLFPANVLGSALLFGILTSLRCRQTFHHSAASSACPDAVTLFPVIDDCISSTVQSIVRLGIYIIMFSLFGSMLRILLPDDHMLTLFLCTILEVTGGIHVIADSALPFSIRYILINALCCFGGLCALAQTAGITSMNRHALLHYIKSRVLITLLSALVSCGSVLFCLFL